MDIGFVVPDPGTTITSIPEPERGRLIAWYLGEFSRKKYGMGRPQAMVTEHKADMDLTGEESCGINPFEGDMAALFTLLNLTPLLGGELPVYIPSFLMHTKFKRSGLKKAYDDEYTFYYHTKQSVPRIVSEIKSLLRRTQLSHPQQGLFMGRISIITNIGGHGISYAFDMRTKTYEIFDSNGQMYSDHYSVFQKIRNIFPIVFKQLGLSPFGYARVPRKSVGIDESGDIYMDENPSTPATPGMVNQIALPHGGMCGLWAVLYLFLRTFNSSQQMYQWFSQAAPSMPKAAAATTKMFRRLFLCVSELFRLCGDLVFDVKGVALGQIHRLQKSKGHKIIDFRVRTNRNILHNMLRVVFLCVPYSREYVQQFLSDCSPEEELLVQTMCERCNLRFPWK